MTGRFQDTLDLRSLLSYAINASTENPIIIIDRYTAIVIRIKNVRHDLFLSVTHSHIKQLFYY